MIGSDDAFTTRATSKEPSRRRPRHEPPPAPAAEIGRGASGRPSFLESLYGQRPTNVRAPGQMHAAFGLILLSSERVRGPLCTRQRKLNLPASRRRR